MLFVFSGSHADRGLGGFFKHRGHVSPSFVIVYSAVISFSWYFWWLILQKYCCNQMKWNEKEKYITSSKLQYSLFLGEPEIHKESLYRLKVGSRSNWSESLVSGSDVLAKNSQIVKAKGASPTFDVVISGSINTQISPNFSVEIGTVFRASHFLNEVRKIIKS